MKLWLCNIVHSPQLKALDVIYPDCSHEYSQSILLLCKEFGKWFQDFKIMEQEFLLFALPSNADMEKDPERLKIEFINLQCYSNLTKKCMKEIGKTLIPTYLKKRFLCSDTLSQEWVWCFAVIICGNSFFMKDNKTNLTNGNLSLYFESGIPVSIQRKRCFRECREHMKDYATRGHPSTMHWWRTHKCSSQTHWPLLSLPSDCTIFNFW